MVCIVLLRAHHNGWGYLEGTLLLCPTANGRVPEGSGAACQHTPPISSVSTFVTSIYPGRPICTCTYTNHTPLNRNHTPSNGYDLLVVGGGIVGMATAREIALRHPNMSIGLVEKEKELGTF